MVNTIDYPKVLRCANCKWSAPIRDWDLKCTHPIVNAGDPYYLSYGTQKLGSDCTDQRRQTGWFAKCGIKGRLYEPRNDLLKAAG